MSVFVSATLLVLVYAFCFQRNIRSSLVSPVDVAITTPDALLGFRRKGNLSLCLCLYL